MDCNFCLFGRPHNLDLYIEVRDEAARVTKRYVGTSGGYRDSKRWNKISVGSL
jgi:hypothetical protein